jgi:hypothetical protein
VWSRAAVAPLSGADDVPRTRVVRAISPAVIPFALALAYLVELIIRFPDLIGRLNSDSDFASAFTLTDAISHGHTGQISMGTQGSWVPLAYGLLTHGLSFHRILWELSPTLLLLAAALLIGWAVARVSTRSAAALTVALILAASPTTLVTFTGAYFHNVSIPGAALLGAYLVWLNIQPRAGARVVASILVLSVVLGALVASDLLLVVVGAVPFLGVSLAFAARRRDARTLFPAIAVTSATVVVAVIIVTVMGSLNFVTTAPPTRITGAQAGEHVKWLAQGLLRMGNGLSIAPHAAIITPLVVAAGVVTLGALAATVWLGGASLARPGDTPIDQARAVHCAFWAASLLCAAVAYVFTTVASEPSDRYFIVAVPAVAACVPLLRTSRRASWLIAAGATVFVTASIVSLTADDGRYPVYRGTAVAQTGRIEALVRSLHLRLGYAGYWNAASLEWSSAEQLTVHPLIDVDGATQAASGVAEVAAWHRPRPHTPTYLILAPGDDNLPDRLPANLPPPRREYRLGQITVAVYPRDLAGYLHES